MTRQKYSKPTLKNVIAAARDLTGSYERMRRVGWAVLFVVLLAAFIATNVIPDRLNLSVGQPAPRDIKAPIEFTDQAATERLRREAAAAVPELYRIDEQSTGRVLEAIGETFIEVERLQRLAGSEPAQYVETLRSRLDLDLLSNEAAEQVLLAGPETTDQLRQGALTVAQQILDDGVRAGDLQRARQRVPDLVRALEFHRPYEQFVSLLVQQLLEPNEFFDEPGTLAARERAAGAVAPVLIRKNQILVREGQPVAEEDLVRLRDAGLLRETAPIRPMSGAVLLSVLMTSLIGGYLRFYNPSILASEQRLILIGLITLATLVLSRVLLPVSGFVAPLAAGAMLLSILIDARLAAFIALLSAGLLALLAGSDLQLLFVTLTGALVGVFSVTTVGQRSDLMRAGIYVGAANAAVVLIWTLLFGNLVVYDVTIWRDASWALIGGILSAVLTIGTLPFFETFFGILTPVRLLELANPNQPLLRRLLMEAPGTYHHSIMVANLCEAAADQVGADGLLARVGAYYHDIGKMKRPYFFIENQFASGNPHDKLAPNLSAIIITAHVKDGVELAREHNLPEELIKFIREHHGTMIVEYFYHKAMEDPERQGGVLEENFRYPGPIPRSKETAICMLADGAEAIVRSMAKPTPGRIEATVRKLIRERLNAGQLDHCDLTLADLDQIAETFTQVLSGLFHTRIEYPESVAQEIENVRKSERGRVGSGSTPAQAGPDDGEEAADLTGAGTG